MQNSCILKHLEFIGLSDSERRDKNLVPYPVSPTEVHGDVQLKFLSPGKNGMIDTDSKINGRNVSESSIDSEFQTSVPNKHKIANIRGSASSPPIVDEAQTPLANLTNNSCSKDWRLSSGDKSVSVKQARKFKRLRKLGDLGANKSLESIKDGSGKLARTFSGASAARYKHGRGILRNISDASRYFPSEALKFFSISCLSCDGMFTKLSCLFT